MPAEVLGFKVSGREVFCSARLWEPLQGPKPELPMDWESDGCSGGAPDVYRTLFGRAYKLWPACIIHDDHYRHRDAASALSILAGEAPHIRGAKARKLADDTLRANIVTLVKLQGGSAFTAHRIAWLYWGRVRIWGATSWGHWNGNRPLGFLSRVREAYGLD